MSKIYLLDYILSLDVENNLSEDVINKINTISTKVGAPTYRKTPIFKKREKRKNKAISNEDWTAMRNFKVTELMKNTEGLEFDIDKIRSLLNKLTDKNYIPIKDELINTIESIITNDSNDLEKVATTIYDIGSMNKFWSKLYAQLYKDLIKIYPSMLEPARIKLEVFTTIFNDIEWVDPEENYDKFCEINKTNEKRRALSSFFIHLVKNEVIDVGKMYNILIKLIQLMETKMVEENKINEVEEISENISIIILEGYDIFEDMEDESEFILEHVNKFSSMKASDFPSLNSKVIFKYMDLLDEIE